MGLLTSMEERRQRAEQAKMEKDKATLLSLQRERENLKMELELQELIQKEKDLLDQDKRRLKDLKVNKYLGWLK